MTAKPTNQANPTPSSANAPPLLQARCDGVARLTLNRPQQLNSLSEEMLQALQDALDDVAADPAVRVVVITGAGRAFSSGHDLKQVRARPEEKYYQAVFSRSSKLMLSLLRLPQPVIARVNGIATAAGCQLVATCDLAIASSDATFAVSGINNGLFCSTPSVALGRNVARKDAFEMLFTGEFIDAETARERGLVNRVVAPQDLDAAVQALSDVIRAKSRVAVHTGKRMFYEQLELDPEGAYRYATAVMAGNMMDPDAQEGVSAFLDKRPPRWTDA